MNQQGIDISETRNILCFLCLELLEFWDYELHAIIELVFYSMLSHCGHCGPGPTTAKCVALCVWTRGIIKKCISLVADNECVMNWESKGK